MSSSVVRVKLRLTCFDAYTMPILPCGGSSSTASLLRMLKSNTSIVSECDGFLGVSLGNNFYSQKRLSAYFAWAKVNLRRFAILIGDWIFAYTHSYFHECSLHQSQAVSLAMGDAAQALCEKICTARQQEVTILRWTDLQKLQLYSPIYHECCEAFRNDKSFREATVDQIHHNLRQKINFAEFLRKTQSVEHPLVQYMMHELAGLVSISEQTIYNVEVYPGEDLELISSIYNNTYPNITDRMPQRTRREFTSIKLE